MRTRDLFYGLWIPDLFMKRVKENSDWTLFSPNEAVGLSDVYGEEFENYTANMNQKVLEQRLVLTNYG